jgi:creatinine amidohydrolase
MPYEVAVIPIGATEAHNLHLPYATDTLNVTHVAHEAAERANGRGAKVLVLPSLAYGQNDNCLGFPLTISVKTVNTQAVIGDILKSLETHGVYKCVILNGHGGNNLQAVVRDLNLSTKVFVGLIGWPLAARRPGDESPFEKGGEHANESETSCLMVHRPDLVHLERADEGQVRTSSITALEEGWMFCARPWDRLTTSSGYGDPRKSTPEKGHIIVERAIERISQCFCELAKAPMDENFPFDGPSRDP